MHNFRIMVNLHNRRQHVVSIHVIERFATVKDLATLFFDFFDAVEIFLNATFHVKWAKKRVVVQRITHPLLESRIRLDHAGHKVIVDVLVEEEASKSGASLTTSSDRPKHGPLESNFHVAVRHHDGCIVASEF